ncbi:unnamed protein product [Orchesella dallaii]|uniref:Protein kinase domain-containing protein n=1 Tax=Orchesella dallaii TaxID=48710 RepID=A0ABP1PSQ9_9HEXA
MHYSAPTSLNGPQRKLGGLDDSGSIAYDETRQLGRGSNGTIVFKGLFGNRPAAVKRIHSEIVTQKTIIKETEHLICCDQHENVIRYFSTKVVQQHVLIALELCDMSLKDWVTNKEINISPVEILRQTTVGLQWLHENRIVHRDIKPENILLITEIKKVKISDFGLSRRIMEERSSVSSVAAGTQGWIAPEILRDIQNAELNDQSKLKFTFASDIFSLGCLYYYVLTNGSHAFGDPISRNTNIISGKSSLISENILSVCVHNIIFIEMMISMNPLTRPSCEVLLACPLFWQPDRRVKFLEDLLLQGKELMEAVLASFKKNNQPCSYDHTSELAVLSKLKLHVTKRKIIGCAVPFAYLEYQRMDEIQTYYSRSVDANKPRNSKLKAPFLNAVDSSIPFQYVYRSQEKVESMLRMILKKENFVTVKRVVEDIWKLGYITDYTKFLPDLTVMSRNEAVQIEYLRKYILLLEKSAESTVEEKRGSTFLHIGARKNSNPSFFNELLKYLVSINKTGAFGASDSLGNTVLHYAVQNFEVMEESLEMVARNLEGVDLYKMINRNGESILISAIKGQRSESFLKKLIELGSNCKILSSDKSTVLHYSAAYLNLSALKLFISLGVDVNAQNDIGSTVLHKVFSFNSYIDIVDMNPFMQTDRQSELVKELVNHGANVNLKNSSGKLPIEYAREMVGFEDAIFGTRIIERLEPNVEQTSLN